MTTLASTPVPNKVTKTIRRQALVQSLESDKVTVLLSARKLYSDHDQNDTTIFTTTEGTRSQSSAHSSQDFSQEECDAVGQLLGSNTTLQKLYLEGLRSVAMLGFALQANHTLVELGLFHRPIRDGLEVLASSLASTTALRILIMENCSLVDEDIILLASMGLATNKSLYKLDLSSNNFRDDGLLQLCNALNPSYGSQVPLKTLVLKEITLGAHAATPLATLVTSSKSLQKLDLSSARILDLDPSFHTTLRDAFYSSPGLTDVRTTSAKLLAACLFSGEVEISTGSAPFLNQLREQLWPSTMDRIGFDPADRSRNIGTTLTPTFLRSITLCGMKNQSPGFFGLLCASLADNHVLVELICRKCNVDNEGATALAVALEVNRSIEHVDLRHNMIRQQGATAFGEMLCRNQTLLELLLGGNPCGQTGAEHLCKGLRNNDTLLKLDLGQCFDLSDRSVLKQTCLGLLSDALQMPSCRLISLDLSSNNVTDEQVRHIATMLADEQHSYSLHSRTRTTLRELNLAFNRISDEGASHLASALCSNRTLHRLDLSHNNITDEGIGRLALSFERSNRTLEELLLMQNVIGLHGVLSLTDAMKSNLLLTSDLDDPARMGEFCPTANLVGVPDFARQTFCFYSYVNRVRFRTFLQTAAPQEWALILRNLSTKPHPRELTHLALRNRPEICSNGASRC